MRMGSRVHFTSIVLFLLVAFSISLGLPFKHKTPPTFPLVDPAPPLQHKCIHDEVFDLNAIITTKQHYAPTRDTMKPIRLTIDTSYLQSDPAKMTCTSVGQIVSTTGTPSTYTCQAADVLSADRESYIQNLVDQAHAIWEGTLLVVPVSGSLILQGASGGVYGGVTITTPYTTGVTADMVIFVTARPILSNGQYTSTLAVATVLQQDHTGRPICGQLNINVAGVNMASSMFDQNFGVVKHEMTHALGFNYNLISDLSQQVSLNVAAGDAASQRYIISSPKVQAWAKAYYGCDKVQGVELENQGGSGTAFSHWEKRVTNNEYMTGTASRNPVFSELTLSLLEDTGWYGINYSLSEQLLWGQGMGCDFILRSCPNWPSQYQGYFCTNKGGRGCTADYQAKGVCQISEATNVPTTYQYFDDPGEVGSYDLPDYCPLTWGYDNGWCFDSSQGSTSLVNQGEEFGDTSKCYDSSLLKDLPVGGSTSQVCYTSACTAPDELRVKVGSYWYLCPPGGKISVIGFGGQLSCPSLISQICADSDTDSTWPVFSTISPNAGGPGLKVTISGRNFLAGITVSIDDDLDDVKVVSSTQITATIPNTNHFKNPANIIERKSSVVLTDSKGRSAVGYNAFTIKVKFDAQFIKNALEYLGDNWLITAAIVAALVVTCLICGYCCYRQKGQAEEADTEEYYE